MVNLVKVVNEVRDDLKKEYLKDQSAVWTKPFVVIVRQDDCSFIPEFHDEDKIIEWLRNFRDVSQTHGLVIGRMVAKYNHAILDPRGQPMVTQKAILVSGRMLTTGQTYVTITPCHEHSDLRTPKIDEPLKQDLFIPNITSPDKVAPIVAENGIIKGFRQMQFGDEQIFDSRRGDTCALDPLIEGVLSTPGVPNV